jgi:hypothetical protein
MPTTMQISGARRSSKRKGPIGLAKSYQLTEITPAFLAYVSVVVRILVYNLCVVSRLFGPQVRFSLSSEDTFNDTGSGFNYIQFYNQIREYLESPKFKPAASTLMAWWNQ